MLQNHAFLKAICVYFLSTWIHIKAENIMLRKPRKLSSTFKLEGNDTVFQFHAFHASDGRTSHPARSANQSGPFWQGDLQGFYMVDSISVTSDKDARVVSVTEHRTLNTSKGIIRDRDTLFTDMAESDIAFEMRDQASEIRNAYIGVSSVDVDFPDDDVTWCGQWPADTSVGVTLTFNCSHEQPVRFVRVWRNITGHLAVQEVEVEGTPSRTKATIYNKHVNEKVTTTVTSLNARSVRDCGIKCLETQPCLVFSHNPSADPSMQ